jgi:hypothetical protein
MVPSLSGKATLLLATTPCHFGKSKLLLMDEIMFVMTFVIFLTGEKGEPIIVTSIPNIIGVKSVSLH